MSQVNITIITIESWHFQNPSRISTAQVNNHNRIIILYSTRFRGSFYPLTAFSEFFILELTVFLRNQFYTSLRMSTKIRTCIAQAYFLQGSFIICRIRLYSDQLQGKKLLPPAATRVTERLKGTETLANRNLMTFLSAICQG